MKSVKPKRTDTKAVRSCDGLDLKGMFAAAARSLERNVQHLNSLNVFPVPDGDTGTNMLLTMKAALEEAERSQDRSAGGAARALYRGALMGARGNSGVILSQILRGIERSLEGKRSFNAGELAAALEEASAAAYRGVSKPVEGTMLTVIREAAEAARQSVSAGDPDIVAVMRSLAEAAKASVSRTPSLLPVLRQAGVVDAGGQGLHVMFEAALRYLCGEDIAPPAEATPSPSRAEVMKQATEEIVYGYCTEFLLQGCNLDIEAMRSRLVAMGESVLVVGDSSTVRVHLHTLDPGAALSYATSAGALRQVKVDNLQDQHSDFIAGLGGTPKIAAATVAVASGEGLVRAFSSVGATRIVSCGDTMNPSVKELLDAVESAPSGEVIILPNNPNVLLAAGQVQALTSKKVEIVPSVSIPQGIAALLAFNQEAGLTDNVAAMKSALSSVRSGEVTIAVRSMQLDHASVNKGQAIAFLDGELTAVGDSVPHVVFDLLGKAGIAEGGLVSLYYGADTHSDDAQALAGSVRSKYPGLEVEVIPGGQPHYSYIISVE